MTNSTLIKSQPALTATIKAMMEQGGDCYAKLGNGAYIRIIPHAAFLVYREGLQPSTPRAKRAWENELKTFRRYAEQAGLQLAANPVTAEAKLNRYAARFAIIQPALLTPITAVTP
ncbi:MAG: hypothetical protein WAU96_12470 [Anaerolineae bacterium]|nr:hypothetical protein [Thermoflexales bacterium]